MHYHRFFEAIKATRLKPWSDHFQHAVQQRFDEYTHGELQQWQAQLNDLPSLVPSSTEFKERVRIGSAEDISDAQRQQLKEKFMTLHPWRKGPFELFGMHIDTEWRSDWKWDRLKNHLGPLDGQLILDVGCGNGYHLWRMFGAGADMVLGIEPSQKFLMQFEFIRKYAGEQLPVHLLPIGIEGMPDELGKQGFDTVFSMGVLYHRRSPIDHILHLKGLTRPGGTLVLETLVIPGDERQVLVPEDRYAQMRNVWFLPSCSALQLWMQRCGLKNVRIADVNQTSLEEQRATEWMRFHSLENYLAADNINQTVEGYPAPTRAILIAERPS